MATVKHILQKNKVNEMSQIGSNKGLCNADKTRFKSLGPSGGWTEEALCVAPWMIIISKRMLKINRRPNVVLLPTEGKNTGHWKERLTPVKMILLRNLKDLSPGLNGRYRWCPGSVMGAVCPDLCISFAETFTSYTSKDWKLRHLSNFHCSR